MALTGSDVIHRALTQEGVSRLFGLIGEGNAHLLDRVHDAEVSFTYARHEQVAVTMADTYARLTGSVGACTLTHGPGVTNGATGIAIADRDNTPLVVIVGDSAQRGRETSLQYLDHGDFTRPISAYQTRVETPAALTQALQRTFDKARTRRGPAVIDVPTDIQEAVIDEPSYEPLERPPQRIRGDPERLADAADLLARAEQPAILAGGGARAAGAGSEIAELADHLGAPIATTFYGRGVLPESHPLVAGIAGTFMTPAADAVLWDADVVLVLGAHLGGKATRYGELYADTQLIQVDRDEEVLGEYVRPDCALVSDAKTAVEDLKANVPANAERAADVRETIAAADEPTAIEFESAPEQIDPRELTVEMASRLPPDAVITVDSGNNTGFPALFHPMEAGRMLLNGNFGTMGFALPAGVGAQLARPTATVCSYIGDGAFLMVAQALETAVRLELPFIVVVYNDASYGIIRHRQTREYDRTTAAEYAPPDIAGIAAGFGARSATIRSANDLEIVDEYLTGEPTRPLVLDARTIPSISRPGFPPY